MADGLIAPTPEGGVDLTNCDREPIHIPGSVQPHATLLVLEEPALVIRQTSVNAPAMLGVPLEQILGATLSSLISAADLEEMKRGMQEKPLEAAPYYLNPLRVGRSPVAFEATLHRFKGALILELETWPGQEMTPEHEHLSALKKMLSLSRSAETVSEFCQRTADNVRAFIGFDRVMVYRFDPDLSGHVIAEAKRGDLESFLGLHYPASDIPKQARELFRLSKLRLIPYLGYAPVALVPTLRPDTRQPLDMSFCVTRSVSPVHVEYLQNMGVRASMSISVVIDDQLWGLFACHHYSPRYVPHAIRTACDFLAHALAILVAGREQAEDSSYTRELQEHQRLLDEAIARRRDFDAALREQEGNSVGGIEADGAALVASGQICLKGKTPGEAAVLALARFCNENGCADLFATDRLGETLPGAAALAPGVSGLLAARLSRDEPGYLFWFRGEVLQTVKWAGDVTKPMTTGPLGDRLTPRKSFALWQQEVRGRSQPWLASELSAAENVRNAYHELHSSQTQTLVRLNAEVMQARDLAVQAMQAKDHFLAALSHELRTPLNPALLLASEEAENPALSAAVRANFAAIRDNIELEARLIDDLLDLSRISHGKLVLELKPLDVHLVLRQALAILAPEFAGKRVQLTEKFTRDEAVVNADVVRLLQVFWNVLKNAVKFTPAEGRITVESRIDAARRHVAIRISDTGIGINPQDKLKIFEAFSQGAHAESHGEHRFGGLGLGLAITRSLLTAHAGKISVESAGLNQGSTFTIELPLAPEGSHAPFAAVRPTAMSRTPPTTTPAEPGGKSQRNVLLVEDHAPTRASLSLILERRNYHVTQASTIAEALSAAACREFALVISDIGLPDGDGYACLRELRKMQPAIKAIALSGYGMESDRERSRTAGFVELLIKPTNIQTLERTLAAVFPPRAG